jgi:hypothetical protein
LKIVSNKIRRKGQKRKRRREKIKEEKGGNGSGNMASQQHCHEFQACSNLPQTCQISQVGRFARLGGGPR